MGQLIKRFWLSVMPAVFDKGVARYRAMIAWQTFSSPQMRFTLLMLCGDVTGLGDV